MPKTKGLKTDNEWKSKHLQKVLAESENEIRDNDYERIILYDKNGELISTRGGGAHSVDFVFPDGTDLTNCVATHNHPNGSTFSHEDISDIFEMYNIKELRATTRTHTFSITKAKATSITGEMGYDYFVAQCEYSTSASFRRYRITHSESDALKKYSQFCRSWLQNNAYKYGYIYKEDER